MDLTETPHRRFNPLTREWVLVSPHRTKRPWQGQVEKVAAVELPSYVPDCYLCPGNERAGGVRNPAYESTFVFENDFAALRPDQPAGETTWEDGDILRAEAERGLCRVMCFSPRHDLTLATMPQDQIRGVVDLWAAQSAEVGGLDWVRYVQIFENRGAMMGASNPHPHCQLWASAGLPNEIAKEQASQSAYLAEHGKPLLEQYLETELARRERVVIENDEFVVAVPFWAVWPFEAIILPKRPAAALEDLDDAQRDALAAILKRLTAAYDRLFETPFPYSMGFHQRPHDGRPHPEWTLHAHFYPPLLRSATVRKFMVGYELLAGPQRDLTPESAAARLRELV